MKNIWKKTLGCKLQQITKLNITLINLKKEDAKYKTEDSQPCKTFIAEELPIDLILDTKTIKAGELKIKHFSKCRLAIEVDELGHKDRDQTKGK